MIKLKSVIHYADTNSVEATWVDVETVTGEMEDGTPVSMNKETVVRCHSYADVQMDMLRADLGADAAKHEALIVTVETGIVPPAPDSPAVRWAKIKAKRDELTDNGGCQVAGKWFHTDAKSKQQQMALAMLGAALPAGLMWKTMDGSFVEMTPALASELFAAQVLREQSIFAHAESLKTAPAADINAGWPDRYAAGAL